MCDLCYDDLCFRELLGYLLGYALQNSSIIICLELTKFSGSIYPNES